MTIDAIKEAIAALPEEERISLSAWLALQQYDDWDREMVRDFSSGGRGMPFVEKVKREIAEGKANPIEEGFAQHRKRIK
jgi:hypothetical protein